MSCLCIRSNPGWLRHEFCSVVGFVLLKGSCSCTVIMLLLRMVDCDKVKITFTNWHFIMCMWVYSNCPLKLMYLTWIYGLDLFFYLHDDVRLFLIWIGTKLNWIILSVHFRPNVIWPCNSCLLWSSRVEMLRGLIRHELWQGHSGGCCDAELNPEELWVWTANDLFYLSIRLSSPLEKMTN